MSDGKKKVIEHPSTKLIRKIEEQTKQIEALKLDVVVLRDLLLRTVRILAKYEANGGFNVIQKPDKPDKKH